MTAFTPSVSVIVPAYNCAKTIDKCLESLLAQNYPADAYEIIVVENGSTDTTAERIAQYPVRLYRNQRRGPAPARNLGIGLSQATIVAFTDSDCIAHPDWIAELVKPYLDPQVGGTGGMIESYRSADPTPVERFCDECLPLVNFISGEAEYLPHLYTANASYRRELLQAIGGFNDNLFTAEDVDLSWRLQLRTQATVASAPQAIIYHWHRSTRQQLARQYRQYGFGEILVDMIYGDYPGYPRKRAFQIRRMLGQVRVLPRYMLSLVLRRYRLARGRVTPYEAMVPGLWLLIEASNLRGKLEALFATRLMRRPQAILSGDVTPYLKRYY